LSPGAFHTPHFFEAGSYIETDTRLGRTVAVKLLSQHFSPTPDLKQRFQREARAIATLNHPHICVLHDVGHADGTDYLVMEYVEGETLAARLATLRRDASGSGRQGLAFKDMMRYAVEIADALDAAHRHHIVHRDLKPANVMLTKSGVKLLDFGLAKLREPQASTDPDPTATEPVALTGPHTVLGTLQYMAPEQLQGRDVDARADIFAFGAVVYEMATGAKAFDGQSRTAIATAILESHPPAVSTRQQLAPAAFDRAIRKCLEKDPDERWQTARDLASELRWIAAEGKAVAPAPAIRRSRRAFAAVALGLAAFVMGGIAGWSLLRPAVVAPQDSVQFTISLPPGEVFPIGSGLPSILAISPDGQQIVYAARRSGGDQLYLRRRRDLTPIPLAGTEGAIGPFFSPDGQWIGFASGGVLKKMQVGGGAPQVIARAPNLQGASWGPDDTIVYAPE
jgi:serine/threonine-protein kinase